MAFEFGRDESNAVLSARGFRAALVDHGSTRAVRDSPTNATRVRHQGSGSGLTSNTITKLRQIDI